MGRVLSTTLNKSMTAKALGIDKDTVPEGTPPDPRAGLPENEINEPNDTNEIMSNSSNNS